MDFAGGGLLPARKSACLRFRNFLKGRQLARSHSVVGRKNRNLPWRKNANPQRKNRAPSVRNGKSQPRRRFNRWRRFYSGSKERCPHLAAPRTRVCQQTKVSRCLPRLISKTLNTRTYSFRHSRQGQVDLGADSTQINTILPAVGITTTHQRNF